MPDTGMFTTAPMSNIFSPRAHVQRMLDFEAALARAEAAAGVIPPEAAEAIAAACRADLYVVDALYAQAVEAGTPAIPLVRMLTRQVAEPGGAFVHYGGTSQDAIDTALMLQMRDGLALLDADLLDICEACARLAEQHRDTLMPGRTLLQQALPITFGLKAARWLALMCRQVEALRACRDRSLALQFGGAAGTLAALGDSGMHVAELLAQDLDLPLPDLPWHAERDRVANLACALGVTAGAVSKVAGDIVLLAQTEVGEATEASAPGKGGSSALPQKRNPVDSMLALAASRLALGHVPVVLSAMQQEHERAAGAWQVEWEAIPNLFCYTAAAVSPLRSAVQGLQPNPERMRQNLDVSHGLLMSEALMMALAARVGRPEAQSIVQSAGERAVKENRALRDVALADEQILAHLSPEDIERALDPAHYLGSTGAFIDRALEAYRALSSGGEA
jgi:3-carboxy-cis,cis-muconate cycloisomerase